jgi:predicted nucleic acid-binding protein
LRFVLDTNVILKALIKDSFVRGIILASSHEFFVPEHLIEETRRHLDLVARKSGLSKREIDSVLETTLLARVKVVAADKILSRWEEASSAMEKIDRDDVVFVAAAMGENCDGIWSGDRHLRRQKKVRVWTTKGVAGLSLRRE